MKVRLTEDFEAAAAHELYAKRYEAGAIVEGDIARHALACEVGEIVEDETQIEKPNGKPGKRGKKPSAVTPAQDGAPKDPEQPETEGDADDEGEGAGDQDGEEV